MNVEPPKGRRGRWIILVAVFIGFLLISAVFGYLIQHFLSRFHISRDIPTWLVFLIIFGVALVANLSAVPLPFAISLMVVAAMTWNPVLVALFGSLGATFGEFSSYIIGRFGGRIAISEKVAGYQTVQRWIQRYGAWGIAFLSFQPIIPFEIGGFIAGLARMPVHLFLPALWLGKFPKYLLLIYAALGLIHFFPVFPRK